MPKLIVFENNKYFVINEKEIRSNVKTDIGSNKNNYYNVKLYAKKVVKWVRYNEIGFPYKRFDLYNDSDSMNKMYKRLVDNKNEWNYEPYKIKEIVDDVDDIRFIFIDSSGKKVRKYVSDRESHNQYRSINIIIDYFIEDSLIHASRNRGLSPYNLWYDNEFLVKAITDCIMRNGKVDPYLLREEFYYSKLYNECSHEKATFTLNLFKLLLNDDKREYSILDACAGYGDRLLAAIAGNYFYYGIEPNTMSQKGFNEMIDKYGDKSKHFVSTDYMPYAKIDEDRIWDLVFFSPPSWNSETYEEGVDNNQSINMFKDRDEWKNGFLYATIDRLISLLDDDGYFVLQSILADEIVPYIKSKNMYFIGCISVLTGAKRFKPMWIFTKYH